MTCSEITRNLLLDQHMAQLGDSFVNFIYSLSLSQRGNKPVGRKVSDRILAEAARIADLRQLLPKRTSRGDIANSVEALLVYAWLNRLMTINEMTETLQSTETAALAFAKLAKTAFQKLNSD